MNGTLFCSHCGTPMPADARFCGKCGATTQLTSGTVAAPTAVSSTAYSPSYAAAPAYPAAGGGYGGFWIRFVATIIDAIIVNVIVMPLSFLAGGFTGVFGSITGMSHRGLPIVGGAIGFGIGVLGGWLYEAFMTSSSYQATLGKMIFGMKISDLQGNRISFERATGRHFAKWLSGLILMIGYIMAGFTERKQALHDMIAGTLVRKEL